METTMGGPTLQEVLDAMGNLASEAEGEAMIEILRERGLTLSELSNEEFFALIPAAIARAKR